jgi:hypothetical protein
VTLEAGIRPLFGELPEGVTARIRSDGKKNLAFVMNFTNGKRLVPPESGRPGIELGPFEVKILRSEANSNS